MRVCLNLTSVAEVDVEFGPGRMRLAADSHQPSKDPAAGCVTQPAGSLQRGAGPAPPPQRELHANSSDSPQRPTADEGSGCTQLQHPGVPSPPKPPVRIRTPGFTRRVSPLKPPS